MLWQYFCLKSNHTCVTLEPVTQRYALHWWLVRVTLVVDWLFLPEILVWWWGPRKAFCYSVNVHGVVVLFASGGDTSTLHVITKLFELFAPRGSGEQKISSNCMGMRPHAYGTRPHACLMPSHPGHKASCPGHPECEALRPFPLTSHLLKLSLPDIT